MKIKTLILAAALMASAVASAQTAGASEKITPDDQVFIDMAVSAAKTSVADGNEPCGAVLILNGAWRSTGMPSNGISPEEVAINKSRAKSLANAALYTVVQPTTAALNAIEKAGVGAVYYAIDAATAIQAGIYKAEDYDNAPQLSIPMVQIPYAEANALIKK